MIEEVYETPSSAPNAIIQADDHQACCKQNGRFLFAIVSVFVVYISGFRRDLLNQPSPFGISQSDGIGLVHLGAGNQHAGDRLALASFGFVALAAWGWRWKR